MNTVSPLRIAVQIHQIVADRGVLVRRHEPRRFAAALSEKNRAAVEAERLAELARDRLQDVHEV